MFAYATMRSAARAISDARSMESAKIREAMTTLHLAVTPFGPIKFDGNGQNQHPVMVTQIQGGQYRVVYPPDVAESKPIIPTPEWSKR